MNEWRNEDDNKKKMEEKEKSGSGCQHGCAACRYVKACRDNEKEIIRKVNAEIRIDEEIKKGKERVEDEEKIEREPGRVIMREEYRRSAKDRSNQSDTVWNDKSFTAVEEIKNWGEIGKQFEKMWGEEIKYIPKDSADKLKRLCLEFEDIWKAPDKPIKTKIKHKIELIENMGNITQKPYKMGPKEEQIMRELVREWEKMGIIRRVVSGEYRAPAILVPKPDGTMRMVIDFRKLNKITRKNKYPMNDTEQVMWRLNKSKWFSKFDLSNGFYQVLVDEESRQYTTFVTRDGMYEFVRMPMGLTNSPATFAGVMDDCLGDLSIKGVNMECYVDDILVHSETFEDHLDHLRILFTRLRERDIKLKPSKCLMARKGLGFLGHVISENGISPDPQKVEAVRNWETPKNSKKLHTFLGLTGYYRKFIRGYSSTASCLYALIKPKAKWEWSSEHDMAFIKLRDQLCSEPIVSAPDWNRKFILQTDAATKTGIGCVLIQRIEIEGDGKKKNYIEKVIAYASKKLTDAEARWSVREIEAYAIVWGITHFHLYTSQAHFDVETDHQSLKWLFSWDKPGRLNRWALRLQEYDFDIIYRKGSANGNADALSRKDESEERRDRRKGKDTSKVGGVVWKDQDVEVGEINNIRSSQQSDKITREIMGWLKTEETECKTQEDMKKMEKMKEQFVMVGDNNDEILYKLSNDSDGEPQLRLVVPKDWQEQIVTYYHASPTGGHLGFEKIYPLIREKFYWGGMSRDIKKMTKGCVACVCSRTTAKDRNGLMQLRDDVGYPGEAVSIDTLGPFSESTEGNKYMATFVDHFTLAIDIEPLKDKRAETMALALYKYVTRNGLPKRIVTDRGSEFVNKLMEEFTKRLGVDHVLATAHHHQSMGIVERVHRVFRDGIRAYIDEMNKVRDWDVILFGLMSAMNSTYKRKLGCSPFFANHGRNMANVWDIGAEAMEENATYISQMVTTLRNCYNTVKAGIAKEGLNMKRRYDDKQKGIEFVKGEEVAIFYPVVGKTRRQWRAGFTVVSMASDVNVVVRCEATGKEQIVHVKRVAKTTWGPKYKKDEKYKGVDPDKWIYKDRNICGIRNEDIMVDDVVVFAYRLRTDDMAQYYVGKILEQQENEFRVHFLKPTKNKRASGEWKYVYVDKKDGKEIHTNSTKYKYMVFDAWVTKQEILMTRVVLDSKWRMSKKAEEEAVRRIRQYRSA